jgi:cell wall assembly regulator SMI1
MCIDISPTEGGQVGQLIYVNMDMQSGHVLAAGFKEWLSTFADELENGQFYWDEEVEMIRRSGRGLFQAPE